MAWQNESSPRQPTRRPSAVARALLVVSIATVIIIIIMVAAPHAQQARAVSYTADATSRAAMLPPGVGEVSLLVGRSAVLNLNTPITRVSLTTPEVADALVTSPYQVLIHGKTPGTISMFVWDQRGDIFTYEVVVARDLSALTGQMQQLFPGESIAVAGSGKDVVLSGTVSSKYVVEKAADVAGGYVETPENVVNLLRQEEGVASNQVLLRVRFAEVSRTALQELGASFFTGLNGHRDYVGRVTTQQFAAPDFDNDEGLVFSDFLNFFLFNTQESLGTLIRALSTQGLFQSLAEPNVIAQNGKEASFLAGGEFPYPVVQGSGLATAVTIMFKEFGVRLNFTPTILRDDLINLKVRPEVSALDFRNAVTIEGFRVPALSTRRTETEIELRDGQTFAIAGLLNNTVTESMSKVPGIGDIPILGLLFRSRARQKEQTELVVMITPQILRSGSTGAAPGIPDLIEPFLQAPDDLIPAPPPYVPQPSALRAPSEAPSLPFNVTSSVPVVPAATADDARGTVASTDAAAALASAEAGEPEIRAVFGVGSTPPSAPAGARPTTAPTVVLPTPAEFVPMTADGIPYPRGSEEWREAMLELGRRWHAVQESYERAEAEAASAVRPLTEEEAWRLDADAAERAAKEAEERRKAEEKMARERAKWEAEAAERAAKEAEERRKAEERMARERAKREAEAAERAAKEAEERRKAEEAAARERAKREAEEAKRAAKEAEARRKFEERQAREQAKREAEQAKRDAEEARRAAKEAEEAAEELRKTEERVARERAKREAEWAKAAKERAEELAKSQAELEKARAAYEAELQKVEALEGAIEAEPESAPPDAP